MLTEKRNHSLLVHHQPRWQRELRAYHRNADYNMNQFQNLVSQTACELQALSKFSESKDAKRVLIDQQVRLCSKCLARIERELADEPDLRASVNDPLVISALDKRQARREKALGDEAQDHNTKQLRWKSLLEQASKDVDLCRDLATQTQQSPTWGKKLGERMKATAIAMLTMLDDESAATLDTTIPSASVSEWLARSRILLEREDKKS